MAVVIVGADTSTGGLYGYMMSRYVHLLQARGIDCRIVSGNDVTAGATTPTMGWLDELIDNFHESIQSFKYEVAKLPVIRHIMNPVVPRLKWLGSARIAGLDIRRFIPRRV